MKCPRCALALASHRLASGRVYACPKCGGCAATLSFVRQLAGPALAKQFWPKVDGFRASDTPCVTCKSKFSAVTISTSSGEAEVDVCQNCQLVWFDVGELPLANADSSSSGEMNSRNPCLPPGVRQDLAIVELAHAKEVREALAWGDHQPDGSFATLITFLGLPAEKGVPEITSNIRATWLLLGLCFISFIAMLLQAPPTFIENWGFIPSDAFRHGGLTIVTSIFIHAGILHLLGNSYCFALFGDNVEDRLGTRNFTILFFAACLAGLTFHAAFDPQPNIPVVGASAGISGLMVLYGMCFPHARLVFYSLLLRNWYAIPVWLVLCAWGVMQVFMANSQLAGRGTFSAFGHLGGALAGLIAWALLQPGKSGNT